VELRVGEGLPVIRCDVGRLELALLNLLSNGIKYADMSKPDRRVKVLAGDADEERCQLLVRDNGIGIPRARLGSIFDRFSRAHADRDEALRVTGLGLGLSIVADCTQALGGQIAVQSDEGLGTTFILTLPKGAAR
jgi:signal transduction histidine kinase